jgi:hypothetical protein
MKREEGIKEIAEMQRESSGKVFMGMVHQGLYGPLRGLNFILEGAKPESIIDLMDNPTKEVNDLVLKIWSKTGLSTSIMVLPFEMIDEAESKPAVVDSVSKGVEAIHKSIRDNKGKSDKDPFFYRLGVI